MFEILIFFVCSVVIGLMFLFFGYAFFRILLPIWGFFVGLMFGVHGMQALFGANVIGTSSGFILGIFSGIILAALAYLVFSLAIYWFGLTIGYVLGSGLMMAIGMDGFMSVVVGAVVAVLLTIVFVKAKMPKNIIVILTSLGGAMAIMMGIFVLFGAVPQIPGSLQLTSYLVTGSWFWLIIWAVLAAIGLTFQYAVIRQTNEDLSREYVWATPVRKTKKKKKK